MNLGSVERILHICGWLLAVVLGFRSAPLVSSIAVSTALLEIASISGMIPRSAFYGVRFKGVLMVILGQVLLWILFSGACYAAGRGLAWIVHRLF